MNGIKITLKDIGFIITVLAMVIGFFVKFEVMKTQVEKNTVRLDLNPPEVAAANRQNMARDLAEIKADVKDLAKAINIYFQEH